MNKPQQVVIGRCAILLGIGGLFVAKLAYDPKGGIAKISGFQMAFGAIVFILVGLFLLIDAVFS